ncbi:MAG: M48 family metalloprotease [bacterium]|nr:M48 family metalloprotease [bacterium]
MRTWRKVLCIVLSNLMLALPMTAQVAPQEPTTPQTLDELLNMSYAELIRIAPTEPFPLDELKRQYDARAAAYKLSSKNLEEKIKRLQKEEGVLAKELEKLSKDDKMPADVKRTKREALHCQIFGTRTAMKESALELFRSGNEYYDHEAKLLLLYSWPADKKAIESDIAAGSPLGNKRSHADVEDIGLRTVCSKCDTKGQSDDIKLGAEYVQQLEALKELPYYDDPVVEEYANRLAQNIRLNSDVRVPVKVRVLDNPKMGMNAFALPGGYFFVNKDLILGVKTEAQLAGVIAHEEAHIAARHGQRLNKRAGIWGMVFQAAQVASIFVPGGYAVYQGINVLLQIAGFGVIAQMSGVSREFEAEADQLAAQWLWKTGYHWGSFADAFDEIQKAEIERVTEIVEKKEGMLKVDPKELGPRNSGWLATHPASYDRIMATQQEGLRLAAVDVAEGRVNRQFLTDTPEFQAIQQRIRDNDEKKRIEKEAKGGDEKAPTLHPDQVVLIDSSRCAADGTVLPEKPVNEPTKSSEAPEATEAPEAPEATEATEATEPTEATEATKAPEATPSQPSEDDRPILRRNPPSDTEDEKSNQ